MAQRVIPLRPDRAKLVGSIKGFDWRQNVSEYCRALPPSSNCTVPVTRPSWVLPPLE